ncbi:calcium-binding protein [Streptomyces sp. JNUCC 64]
MRMRAPVAVVSGALALSALTVPSAQAAGADGGGPALPDAPVASAASALAAERPGKITKVTVNGGKDVVVGLTKKRFAIEVKARHNGVAAKAMAFPYRGSFAMLDPFLAPSSTGREPCSTGRTILTCAYSIDVDPKTDRINPDLTNKDAGVWKVFALSATDEDDHLDEVPQYTTVKLKRAAELTADASPGTVRRGANVTVKGDLTRADWNTVKYGGFASGAVKLQFKKAGGTWKTVKTVAADSRGKVKTTVKASADGSYRFTYGGSTTTGGAKSAADRVDVR